MVIMPSDTFRFLTRTWRVFPVIVALAFNLATQIAMAADTVDFCATGTMTMGPFDEHIAEIRKANRYEKADIEELIAEQKAGGPDFFSTQDRKSVVEG